MEDERPLKRRRKRRKKKGDDELDEFVVGIGDDFDAREDFEYADDDDDVPRSRVRKQGSAKRRRKSVDNFQAGVTSLNNYAEQ